MPDWAAGTKHSAGFQRNQKKVAPLQTNNGAQWRNCVMWQLDRQALQRREEVMEGERKEEKKGWRWWERIKACVTASPGPERGLMHPDGSSFIHQHMVVSFNIFLWHSESDDVSLTDHSNETDREQTERSPAPGQRRTTTFHIHLCQRTRDYSSHQAMLTATREQSHKELQPCSAKTFNPKSNRTQPDWTQWI